MNIAEAQAEVERRWHRAAQHHTLGYLSHAVTGWAGVLELQRELAIQFGRSTKTRYLPDYGWTTTFGHIAVMEMLVKMKILGMTDHDYVVLADPEKIVNSTYLDLLRTYLPISPREGVVDIRLMDERLCVFELDGDWQFFMDVWPVVQGRWEAEGRGPLLKLPQEQIDAGRQQLGIGPNDWFVVVHTRTLDDLQQLRATDTTNYVEGFNRIRARGGQLVRIPTGNKELDIFALAQARFGIFGNSGPAYVAGTFGTPALLIDWSPMGVKYPFAGAIILHKQLLHHDMNRLFLPDEYIEPFSHTGLASVLLTLGAEAVPCSQDEITAGVEQMLNATETRVSA